MPLGFNFDSMEHSRRIIANNLSSTIEEISPIINLSRPALSLREWFNPNHQRLQTRNPINENSDSIVINIDNEPLNLTVETVQASNDNHQHHTYTDNFVSNIRESTNSGNHNNNTTTNSSNINNNVIATNTNSNSSINNNNNTNNNNNHSEVNQAQNVTVSAETRAIHKCFENYFTFLTILFFKFVYDNGAEILNFVLLVVTFIQANNDLKREILKQQNRNLLFLLGILCYIIGCFVFINFVVKEPIFFSYSPPLTISQLLWTVAVTDYVLKLITVSVKVLLTTLPVRIVAFQKRGKYYLMVEAASQLFCCAAPLKPWLQYLYMIYVGPDKILGIVLSTIYAAQKGGDIISHIKFFFEAVLKVLHNVSLGVSPSKEQIIASGGICAICHEEYSKPVSLHCKHIFCENCVTTWLDRERSCPLCRAFITDDPIYRDGHTTYFVRLY